MRKRFLGLFLLVMAVILSCCCLPVRGHSGDILSAWTTTAPTIDGTIGGAEWASADTETFPLGAWPACRIYVMNDANNLYLALEIPDATDDANDVCSFFFDNNHNGVGAENGDDCLVIWGIIPGSFGDHYFSGVAWISDAPAGTTDGSGASSLSGGVHYFEFSHPLDTADDPHDFSLSLGDTVGFTTYYTDNAVWVGAWPGEEPDTYGDIIIASSPAPSKPVGGEIFPVDKLALLAPYTAAVLVIATAAVVIRKRRY